MSVQERTVNNEGEEEVKRNRTKILGIFPRREKGSQARSGATTPNPDGRSSSGKPSPRPDEYDDDDLPPREEADGDIGLSPKAATSRYSEEEAVRTIPKTAGFDFKAISKELGKDIDVDRLKQPVARPIEVVSPTTPLERSGSAPPVRVQVVPPADDRGRTPNMLRSVSYVQPARETEVEHEDKSDISPDFKQQLAVADMPSWDQTSLSPKPSPPLSATFKPPSPAPSFAGFNAWSAPVNSSFPPTRSAPPARPHPAEFMADPFTNGLASNVILGGWGKPEKEMAEKNPW